MRITTKGQVTIPQAIREELGLLPHTEVDFVVEGRSVRIVKSPTAKGESRSQRALRMLRGAADTQMTTDQILALTRDP
jgi:AbrB family looped-hinge helix DNA binding protein